MIDLQAVLLRMYTDGEKLRQVIDLGLRSEHLESFSEDAANVFSFARSWYMRNADGVPLELLQEDFEEYLKINWDDDTEVVERAQDAPWVVERLQHRYLISQFKARTTQAAQDKTFKAGLSYDEQLEKAKAYVRDLMQITANSTNERGLRAMSEDIEQFVNETLSYEDDVASGKIKPPITFGFPEIDAMYNGGIRRGEIAFYSAYLKTGKTHLIIKSTLAAALSGAKVALFALEPSVEQTYSILLALAARLPMSHVEGKSLSNFDGRNERDEFRRQIGEEVFDRIYVEHPIGKTSRTLEEMYWKAYDKGVDMVLGDQLSHVWYQGRGKADADWLLEGEKAHLARQLGEETSVASIWNAQLNRGAEGKKNPGSGDLARSLGIGQAADFMVYLSKIKDNDNGRMLSFREPRRGAATKWELIFGFDPMVIQVARGPVDIDD